MKIGGNGTRVKPFLYNLFSKILGLLFDLHYEDFTITRNNSNCCFSKYQYIYLPEWSLSIFCSQGHKWSSIYGAYWWSFMSALAC